MGKGIEGIKMISLRCWLQNMGLWRHSCLALCAQSKAFLIVCWLSIVVPHKHGNLKSNALFWGLSAGQGSCTWAPLLCPKPALLSSELVVIERHSEEKYVRIVHLCL